MKTMTIELKNEKIERLMMMFKELNLIKVIDRDKTVEKPKEAKNFWDKIHKADFGKPESTYSREEIYENSERGA